MWRTERERKQREESATPVDALQATAQGSDWQQGVWAPESLWTDRKAGAASWGDSSGEERYVNYSHFNFSLCIFM